MHIASSGPSRFFTAFLALPQSVCFVRQTALYQLARSTVFQSEYQCSPLLTDVCWFCLARSLATLNPIIRAAPVELIYGCGAYFAYAAAGFQLAASCWVTKQTAVCATLHRLCVPLCIVGRCSQGVGGSWSQDAVFLLNSDRRVILGCDGSGRRRSRYRFQPADRPPMATDGYRWRRPMATTDGEKCSVFRQSG